MAHFISRSEEHLSYSIVDDAGQSVDLTASQAYELLQWLYERSDEMFQALHPETKPEVSL